MSTDYMKLYREWVEDPFFDEQTRAELEAIAGDEKEIEDRFYMSLEFGTAGLRGILGAGTNRMNIYTVGKATQGLANYIHKNGKLKNGVAIAYDCRNMSPEFADAAACVLAANGIKAHVFDSLRPTPELSFAVRYLDCIAGINVTASHNPAAYNGYKVYWEDGAQITPPHDTGIMDEVAAIESFHDVKSMDRKQAEEQGLYETIGEAVDQAYYEEVKKLILRDDLIKKYADEISIVYTPLHGTGNIPVRRILEEIGFTNVSVVPEQEKPDGNFPTVSYPNPEAAEAFELGLALGKEKHADLILATDPDADRLGVYVLDKEGGYHPLTGNMSGCLIAEYLLNQREAAGKLHDDSYLVSTIVSTKLAKAIADSYKVGFVEVLTGFKYIGGKMLESELTGKGHYEFGFEESYGSLAADYARDKDAVAASVVLCEAAAYYKDQGMTLWEAMTAMYEKYGWYRDDVVSVSRPGAEGRAQIAGAMESLRHDPPKELGPFKVVAYRDYKTSVRTDAVAGETETIDLPKSNVLYFELEDQAWVCVRPSGTEPKIKLYVGVRGETAEEADKKMDLLKQEIDSLMERII